MACLQKSVSKFASNHALEFCRLLAVFGSMRGGGGIRPDDAGCSDLLLKVGPPNVAARLSIGEIGESVEVGEVGDIGSAAIVATMGEPVAQYHALGFTHPKEVLWRRHDQLNGGC
jgi:hypothetical protein